MFKYEITMSSCWYHLKPDVFVGYGVDEESAKNDAIHEMYSPYKEVYNGEAYDKDYYDEVPEVLHEGATEVSYKKAYWFFGTNQTQGVNSSPDGFGSYEYDDEIPLWEKYTFDTLDEAMVEKVKFNGKTTPVSEGFEVEE